MTTYCDAAKVPYAPCLETPDPKRLKTENSNLPSSSKDECGSLGILSSRQFDIAALCNEPEIVLLIARRSVPSFIGSGGSCLRGVQQQSQTKRISVEDGSLREDRLVPVRIVGEPQCVAKAVHLLLQSYDMFLPRKAAHGEPPLLVASHQE